MKGKFEDLMRILSDEGKDKEESEESQVNLFEQKSNELTIDYLRAQMDRQREEIEGLKQDREQRKIFSYVIFGFMCIYMLISLALVFLDGYGIIFLSDKVLITLLTTSLANVIGIFNFVAKYLFHPKK
ncbi:hypothetical protein [Paraprevotella clara]|jgi:hypothetical protein|uniref:hypothetical protein n=1 Tax=Paraprevotella clara TaxID=454154 RepID=UPI00206D821D|nr:hypothetical protein [Paraprevotella clara]DAT20383.1 MAG TPA: hypothetical protein [Caudoviricetes sp.]